MNYNDKFQEGVGNTYGWHKTGKSVPMETMMDMKELYKMPLKDAIDAGLVMEAGTVPEFNEKTASTYRTPVAIPFAKEFSKKMLCSDEEQPMVCDPKTFKSICRGQPVYLKQKQSKRLPLTREWLTFDPEADNEVWVWANRIEIKDGVIKMWQEPKRIQ